MEIASVLQNLRKKSKPGLAEGIFHFSRSDWSHQVRISTVRLLASYIPGPGAPGGSIPGPEARLLNRNGYSGSHKPIVTSPSPPRPGGAG